MEKPERNEVEDDDDSDYCNVIIECFFMDRRLSQCMAIVHATGGFLVQ